MACLEDNFKFSRDKKETCSQQLYTTAPDAFSTVNWMTSSFSNVGTEGS